MHQKRFRPSIKNSSTLVPNWLAYRQKCSNWWRRTKPAPFLVRDIETTCCTLPWQTVAAVDVLVSWNFRHIVRLDRIQLFNEVNAALGRGALEIYSPREVTTYGRNEENSSS